MTSEIQTILNNHKVFGGENGSNYTHISMVEPKGKFSLDRHATENFFREFGISSFNLFKILLILHTYDAFFASL